jgi:hypothetical protein
MILIKKGTILNTIHTGENLPIGKTVSFRGISFLTGITGTVGPQGKITLNTPVTVNELPKIYTGDIVYFDKYNCHEHKVCLKITVVDSIDYEEQDICDEIQTCCDKINYFYFIKTNLDETTQVVNLKQYELGWTGMPNVSKYYNYTTNEVETLPTGTVLTEGLFRKASISKSIIYPSVIVTAGTDVNRQVFSLAEGQGVLKRVLLDISSALLADTTFRVVIAGVIKAEVVAPLGASGLKIMPIVSAAITDLTVPTITVSTATNSTVSVRALIEYGY